MTKTFYLDIVQCPKCNVESQKINLNRLITGTAILKRDKIKCDHCGHIFSHDDGFIEFLANQTINALLSMPIYSGVIEIDNFKINVGKAVKVRFKTHFREIYDINFPRPVETAEELFDQIILRPYKVSTEGFIAVSSSFNDLMINKEIKVGYGVSGRDSMKNVPIWHRFLQGAINSIDSQQYGMTIVESISAFDAFFDEFLMNQLKDNRGYKLDRVKQIVKTCNRQDKLFYYLFYITEKTFEDSPYNKDLRDIASLRNMIVHPKEYNFEESDLTNENAVKALETVIKSIKWVNDTKS